MSKNENPGKYPSYKDIISAQRQAKAALSGQRRVLPGGSKGRQCRRFGSALTARRRDHLGLCWRAMADQPGSRHSDRHAAGLGDLRRTYLHGLEDARNDHGHLVHEGLLDLRSLCREQGSRK